MQQRKIMSLGSSVAITLPRSWLKANRLDVGDYINYTIQGDQSLLLMAGQVQRRSSELSLLIDEKQTLETITRSIVAGFLNGYTVIHLKSRTYFTPEQLRLIRSMTSRLYMMIVKADSSSITLHTIIDELSTPIIASMDRIYMITVAMCRDVLLCMKSPDARLLEATISLEDDVDQMKLLISRLIRVSVKDPVMASSQALDSMDCLDYQILVNHVERVAYHLSNIAENLLSIENSGNRVSERVLPVYISAMQKAFNNYEVAVRSCMSRDIGQVDEIIDDEYRISVMFEGVTPLPKHLYDAEKETIVHLIQIRESVNKISYYAAAIAEITIDQTYKKD
jgi:phosphate uptake regulator